ncbi:MAG TPA: serine hydrolase [Acidimicrobiales bacterium]|nr:serine hydrolase [Acidimicrobiales bacterium]
MAPARRPTIGRAQVEAAVSKLQDRIGETMARTGVPGLAAGVVFDDEVILARGFGVSALGGSDEVGPDTVFQIASLSKSLGSSVMCALVREGALAWDDPVRTGIPEFALADPWVSEHVTFADLFSHRSGLPEHAGDLLEDLGYDRDTVLARLRLYPLAPFRASYGYTNFGLTAAGVAGAARAGTTWEGASEDLLYKPLGMASTSSTYAGFRSRPNRATGHVRRDGRWMVTPQPRQPDGQSPAGGVSSSVDDLLLWLATMLRDGATAGGYVVDPGALAQSWLPHAISNPPDGPTARAGFYGLGLNVAYDGGGRLRLGHSGAFALGAGTAMTFYPAERMGIVVLTNGEPTGVAEATTESFCDDVFLGAQRNDWLAVIGPYFDRLIHPAPKKDFAAGGEAAGPEERYTGTYDSDLYGRLVVDARPGGGLQLTLGPDRHAYLLQPHEGDEMWWQFAGENAGPPAAATFTVTAGDRATAVTLDHFDSEGLGTFTRR